MTPDNRYLAQAADPSDAFENLSPVSLLSALHEQQVYLTELEQENDFLRRTGEAMETSRDQFASLYDLTPVGYVSLDRRGVITRINPAACAMLGFDRDSLVGLAFSHCVTPESQDTLHRHLHSLTANCGYFSGDLQMLRADGSAFWANLIGSKTVDGGGEPTCRVVLIDTSSRHHGQDVLEAAEDFARSLIRSMADGFSVVDANGVSLDANDALCRMTGFSREELVGVPPPHPYWPPEEIPRILDAFQATLSGNGGHFEFVFMRKDGGRFPVIVSSFTVPCRKPGPQRYAATVKDITERREMEECFRTMNQTLERRVGERTAELKQSEDRFRLLTEVTSEGIAISQDGILVDANQQLATMYDCALEDLIGRRIVEFIASESQSKVAAALRSGSEDRYEFTGLRNDGSRIPMEAHGRLMVWRGRLARVTALRDLTAEKLADERMKCRNRELNEALRLALVGEISAGIVHQIAQPLSAMGCNVLAARARIEDGGREGGGFQKIFKEIEADVARMRDAVRHLRCLAQSSQLEHSPVDFKVLVGHVLRLFEEEAESHGFRLEVRSVGKRLMVSADAVQLSQVVLNLLRNAFDACMECPPERRLIVIETREIEGSRIAFTVRDAGIGIDPQARDRIFSPLYSTKPDGIGIGLRLSRIIVEAHGGCIEGHDNEDGIGAEFRVILPVHASGDYPKV